MKNIQEEPTDFLMHTCQTFNKYVLGSVFQIEIRLFSHRAFISRYHFSIFSWFGDDLLWF